MLSFTFDINILGGNKPIHDYITDLSTNDTNSLRNKNIIYVLGDNLCLIHPLKDMVSNISRTHKSPTIHLLITKPKSQWSIHWIN